jgi:hypothetical protein
MYAIYPERPPVSGTLRVRLPAMPGFLAFFDEIFIYKF